MILRKGALVLGICAITGSTAIAAEKAAPSAASPEKNAATEKSAPAAPQETCAGFSGPGAVSRDTVADMVTAGLGHLLRKVTVEPERSRGRFLGWKLTKLDVSPACARAMDLQIGDVITRVNGSRIERPEEAHAAMGKLRTADAIRIELIRSGRPFLVRIKVSR